MNVELIKIAPEVAKAKLASYRKAIAAREHSKAATRVVAEYRSIEAGYAAAARGLPLIELSKAMALGGWDEHGRPRFAVARADKNRIRCTWLSGELTFFDPVVGRYNRQGIMRHVFRGAQLPARTGANLQQWWEGNAIVPMVPPDVLPRPDLDLSRRVILWEADWTTAPVDPLLLLPLGGDLYAVEACWDLTPLERAVISGMG
jgi:hypothetical protein